MDLINLSIDQVYSFVPESEIRGMENEVMAQVRKLHEKTGAGNDFLGWKDLPEKIRDQEIREIEECAERLRGISEIVVVVGIGGSYLGARSVIDVISHNFNHLMPDRKNPVVLYAGHNLGEDYLYELIEVLDNYDYSVIVVSKSGTTTEPAVAFRLLRRHLGEKYSAKESKDRIVAITDASRGALLDLAKAEGYQTFSIPDDVGGRYSVLTPVGLLPIAVAGGDIRQLVKGARAIAEKCKPEVQFSQNPAALYAAARIALYRTGKNIEILVNYTPRMKIFSEWWKQLYGESEGKDGKGIFPASVDFTTDLHSMGQYIQDGQRILFETSIIVNGSRNNLSIPSDHDDADGLNYISYKPVSYVNKMAGLGTLLAHIDGGVPNIMIELPRLNEHTLGQLIYFFEFACGISGYLTGVNPFDQPGVEAYKANMFALLGKPGFEDASENIRKRIDILG